MKFQITNSKAQTNSKPPMPKNNLCLNNWHLIIGAYLEFGAWRLEF
jgi:hypothetical protein